MSPNQTEAQRVLQDFIVNREGKIIAQMFEAYRRVCVPPDAGRVQILETKRAYYAGAHSLLDLLFQTTDPGDDITETETAVMESIADELMEWVETQVTAGPNG